MIVNILVFILILVALILVHEWGHFIAARRAGMKVEEFGFGFPPRLWGIKHKGTLFSINAIPLGGFVKIFGEDSAANKLAGSFSSKSGLARAVVLVAGVSMNFIFAALIFAFCYSVIGMPAILDDAQGLAQNARVQIIDMAPKSPAEEVGLHFGDTILAINDVAQKSPADIQTYVQAHKGESLGFKVQRGENTLTYQVQARQNPPAHEGPTGITPAFTTLIKYPLSQSIVEGFKSAGAFVAGIFSWLYDFINGKAAGDFGGPVKIATFTFQFKELGLPYLLRFVGLLSINLAVINILPIPALDGGRLILMPTSGIQSSSSCSAQPRRCASVM